MGKTNISICQLTMGEENISQKKNVITNIHFLHFLQHTNKTCRNQHMGQWTRWKYNLRPAYGLVRWQRLSHFHRFIFKIHSWHNLHITNIYGGECVLQSRSFIYKVILISISTGSSILIYESQANFILVPTVPI